MLKFRLFQKRVCTYSVMYSNGYDKKKKYIRTRPRTRSAGCSRKYAVDWWETWSILLLLYHNKNHQVSDNGVGAAAAAIIRVWRTCAWKTGMNAFNIIFIHINKCIYIRIYNCRGFVCIDIIYGIDTIDLFPPLSIVNCRTFDIDIIRYSIK